jgi:exopolyphosphatase/guanosine-5'-triphosphate,3'-diphosphate pyrophosphatase
MKVAALDLGSNTSLLLIAEVKDKNILKIYRDVINVTRMGQDVQKNKAFHPEALKRMDQCLSDYAQIIKNENVDAVLAMATSAARDVSNKEELFALGEKYNIPIEIIPGEREAEITFLGSTFEYKNKEGLLVIDVGGGSTEVIGSVGGKLLGLSFDLGSVRLTEMFLPNHPVPDQELKALISYIEQEIKKGEAQIPMGKINNIVAVAGTPTTLAAVVKEKPYSSELVHNSVLTVESMRHWLMKLAKMSVADRQKLTGMDPKRADVIVAGLAILLQITEHLGMTQITVSDRGVRFGVALNMEMRR